MRSGSDPSWTDPDLEPDFETDLDPEGPSAEDLARFDRDDPDEDTWEESELKPTRWWVPLVGLLVLAAFLLAVLR